MDKTNKKIYIYLFESFEKLNHEKKMYKLFYTIKNYFKTIRSNNITLYPFQLFKHFIRYSIKYSNVKVYIPSEKKRTVLKSFIVRL